MLAELCSGAWELAHLDGDRLTQARSIVHRYSDVPVGVADAANFVLTRVYQSSGIATLDRRDYSTLRFDDGSAPRILP